MELYLVVCCFDNLFSIIIGSHSFIRSNRLNFDKICIFHKHLRSSCGAERKFLKKIYRSEFVQSSFIFVIYLLKEVYRKNYERNPFCGQNSIWGSYRDWLLSRDVIGRLSVKPWCYWLWRLVISNWCVSIRLLSQLNSRLLLVKLSVLQSFSRS